MREESYLSEERSYIPGIESLSQEPSAFGRKLMEISLAQHNVGLPSHQSLVQSIRSGSEE
jgi:hypothetical protein